MGLAVIWPAAHLNLDRMYNGTEPGYRVTLWFQAFANAAKDHTPPSHQYLDENDEPMIDFNALETIDKIGNGMYRKRPKITGQKAKRAQNRWNEVSYLNLPGR